VFKVRPSYQLNSVGNYSIQIVRPPSQV